LIGLFLYQKYYSCALSQKAKKEVKMVNKLKVKGNIYCAGVYALRDLENGDIKYIGSGIETNDSMSRHLHHLKRDLYTTTNKAPLQEIYDREA
jgi:hypothetical protein